MQNARQRAREANNVTWVGLIINLVLTGLKFAAGFLGRSAAMVADAVHSLSDLATDLVVLAGVKLSSKPADKDHAYGHGRFETIATAVIALALFAVGVKILLGGVESVRSIASGHPVAKPHLIALLAALFSIIVKEWLYRYTLAVAVKIDSQMLTANAWHHRSDALSSIGTLCGIAGAYFLGERWVILDPLAAIIVSFFIFESSWQILKTAGKELLEASLGEKVEREIVEICAHAPHTPTAHDVKTRRIGNRIAIEMHLYLPGNLTLTQAHDVTETIENKLKAKFGPGTFIAIHPEPAPLK